MLRDNPFVRRLLSSPGSPGVWGHLTELCGQHCEVVPDMGLSVQGHCRADGAILGLNREAALQIRVGEDGVSGEDGTELGLIWGQGHSLLLPPPFLFLSLPPSVPLLGLMAHLGRGCELLGSLETRGTGFPGGGGEGQKEVERERHCLSFRLWGLFWGPRDLCSSPALPQTSCVTLGKLFNLCFLNDKMRMTPVHPSML